MSSLELDRLPGEPDASWSGYRRYVMHGGRLSRVAADLDVDRSELAALARRWRWSRRYRDWKARADELADHYRRASDGLAIAKRVAATPLAAFAADVLREQLGEALWHQADVAEQLGWPVATVNTAAFRAETGSA